MLPTWPPMDSRMRGRNQILTSFTQSIWGPGFQILKISYCNYSFFFFSCVHPSNYNSFPYFLPWVTHSNRYLCFTYNEPKFHCGCWGFLHQRSKLQQQLFSKTHKIICSNGFSFWLAQENINKNEKLKIQVAIPWKASFSDCL